jgi:hypothetical protein
MKKPTIFILVIIVLIGVFVGYEIRKANTVDKNNAEQTITDEDEDIEEDEENSTESETTTAESDEIDLSSADFYIEKTYTDVYANAKYPEIKNESNQLYIDELNQIIKEFVEDEAFAYSNTVNNSAELQISNPTINISYKVDHLENKIISVVFMVSNYMGGATDNQYAKTFNFNLDNSEEVVLLELFKTDSNYLEKIAELSKEYLLNQSYSDELAINRGTEAKAENFDNFYFKDGSIIIVFDKYQVAPGAAGIQEAVISISELEEILSEYGKDLLIN